MGRKFKKTIAWYNKNADSFTLNSSEHPENASLFTPHLEGKRILDAGCGSGFDCNMFQQMGLEPTGIDLSESFINIAKQKFPDLNFIQGNLLSLPFQNEEFDGVWAYSSLLHLETINDVKKALGEFNRILKPSGMLFVRVKKQEGKEKTTVAEDGRFFRFFTQDGLRELITKSGFKVIASEEQPSSRVENEKRIMVLARKNI
jgi:ubiquinone/menaquinone biosynthesis C-methylase UbiE